MDTTGTWIVGAIVAAEAAFWVVLMLGLSARYVLRLRRTSSALLPLDATLRGRARGRVAVGLGSATKWGAA